MPSSLLQIFCATFSAICSHSAHTREHQTESKCVGGSVCVPGGPFRVFDPHSRYRGADGIGLLTDAERDSLSADGNRAAECFVAMRLCLLRELFAQFAFELLQEVVPALAARMAGGGARHAAPPRRRTSPPFELSAMRALIIVPRGVRELHLIGRDGKNMTRLQIELHVARVEPAVAGNIEAANGFVVDERDARYVFVVDAREEARQLVQLESADRWHGGYGRTSVVDEHRWSGRQRPKIVVIEGWMDDANLAGVDDGETDHALCEYCDQEDHNSPDHILAVTRCHALGCERHMLKDRGQAPRTHFRLARP